MASEQGNIESPGAWFRQNRSAMEANPCLNAFAQAASLFILDEYERDPAGIEALGALNLWDGLSAIPLEQYLEAWTDSCKSLQASPALPFAFGTSGPILRHLNNVSALLPDAK
ncbi:hypothetical protein [Bradyrhizobium sp. USDA 3364]